MEDYYIKKITNNNRNYLDIDLLNEIHTLERDIFNCHGCSFEDIENMSANDRYLMYCMIKKTNNKANIVGYLIALDSIDFFEIIKIATKKLYRHKNIATQLLNKLTYFNKDIFLEVRKSNVIAQNFYKKNGFKFLSVRKNYYVLPDEDAYILKRYGGQNVEQ